MWVKLKRFRSSNKDRLIDYSLTLHDAYRLYSARFSSASFSSAGFSPARLKGLHTTLPRARLPCPAGRLPATCTLSDADGLSLRRIGRGEIVSNQKSSNNRSHIGHFFNELAPGLILPLFFLFILCNGRGLGLFLHYFHPLTLNLSCRNNLNIINKPHH